MIVKIKNWFNDLAEREKIIVAVGGVFVVILLFYTVLWSPLNTRVDNLGQQISSNQSLLNWLGHAKIRILGLAQNARNGQREKVTNIMVTVEHSLAEAKLAKYLKAVSQPQANQVQITLNAVPFDKLVDWISALTKHYKIKVSQFQASKGDKFGTVQTQFVLQVS